MICHFKARLLNPSPLAIVRHFCLCETGFFFLLWEAEHHTCNLFKHKEANCDSFKSTVIPVASHSSDGWLSGKPVPSGLLLC